MSANPSEEDPAVSCRTIARYMGTLDPSLPDAGKVRSFIETDLAWRVNHLPLVDKRRFCARDAMLAFSGAIREALRDASADCAEAVSSGSKDKVVVFIHGLGGKAIDTWEAFPDLCRGDADLGRSVQIDLYEYPTGFFAIPFIGKKFCTIQDLAEGLRTYVDHKLSQFREIVLVCHSLGGLVARKYVLNEVLARRDLRVRRMLFYATPHRGAALANLAGAISWRHGQLRQLCRNSDFLQELNDTWALQKVDKIITRGFVVGGQDRVVDRESGKFEDGDENLTVCPFKGHRSLVKPDSPSDLAFLIFKHFVLGR
jgi:pimeloyl-ACP methyl ester carboxylesterase